MQPAPVLLSDQEALAREFRDFTYIVSHDLSAPLRAMVEFSRLLKSEHAKVLDEEATLYLSLIVDSGEKMQAMLAGLLEYSRLNNSKTFTPTDCNDILTYCQTTLQPKITATKAELTIAPLPTLMADRAQLTQLFLALIDNALTYQPPGQAPRITINAAPIAYGWQFTVTDNGIGIAAQYHDRITQIFQRLHTDQEYPGIGTGLAIAKKIIERHNGTLTIAAGQGAGTAFTFTILGTGHD